MEHKFPFNIEIKRDESNLLALSAEIIDQFRGQMFTNVLQSALLEAWSEGLKAPSALQVEGIITITDNTKF